MPERFSLGEQYEELELLYRELRHQFEYLERRGKVPAELIPHRHKRLMRLRQARETLYRLAREEGDGAKLTPPQDFTEQMENAA